MEQASQIIAQLSQDSELMAAELEKAQSGIQAKQIDAQSRERVAQATNQTKVVIAQMQEAGKARDTEMSYLATMDAAELKGWVDLIKTQKAAEASKLEADAMAEGKAGVAPNKE